MTNVGPVNQTHSLIVEPSEDAACSSNVHHAMVLEITQWRASASAVVILMLYVILSVHFMQNMGPTAIVKYIMLPEITRADVKYLFTLRNAYESVSYFASVVELGIVAFLIHSVWLLTSRSMSRYMACVSAAGIALIQIEYVGTSGRMVSIPAVVAFVATGWFLHRAINLRLAYKGAFTHQHPMSISDILLTMTLVVLIGIIPLLVSRWIYVGPFIGLAPKFTPPMLAYIAINVTMSVTIFHMIGYASIAFLRFKFHGRLGFLFLFALPFCIMGVLEKLLFPNEFPFVFAWAFTTTVTYMSGFLFGSLPFFAFGYQLVWAKRQLPGQSKREVRFDDL